MDELAAGFQFPSDRRSLPRSPWLVALGRQIIYACCVLFRSLGEFLK